MIRLQLNLSWEQSQDTGKAHRIFDLILSGQILNYSWTNYESRNKYEVYVDLGAKADYKIWHMISQKYSNSDFCCQRTLFFTKFIWDKVFKNGTSKICGRQPLKNFTSSILQYFAPCSSFETWALKLNQRLFGSTPKYLYQLNPQNLHIR